MLQTTGAGVAWRAAASCATQCRAASNCAALVGQSATMPAAPGHQPATTPVEWADLQYAGRHATLRRGPPRPGEAAAVVAIGLAGRLPAQALLAGLQACQTAPAHGPGTTGLK